MMNRFYVGCKQRWSLFSCLTLTLVFDPPHIHKIIVGSLNIRVHVLILLLTDPYKDSGRTGALNDESRGGESC